jgi:hypothetical protein
MSRKNILGERIRVRTGAKRAHSGSELAHLRLMVGHIIVREPSPTMQRAKNLTHRCEEGIVKQPTVKDDTNRTTQIHQQVLGSSVA